MKKKFFRGCPYDSLRSCRGCVQYAQCKRRYEIRMRKRAAQPVRNAHRPSNAYQIAVMRTIKSKITLKGAIITLAVILFVALMAPAMVRWFTEIAVNVEYDLGIRTTSVETPDPVSDLGIDEGELIVSSTEMESLNEENVTVYPEAAPDEVYTATHEGPRPYNVYFLTYEEQVMIAKVVYKEARGECYEGQVAVAAVVINRYMTGGFGNSIKQIIERRNQFADITDVTMEKLNSVPSCMEAVKDACRGWDPTREWFENGALYFYNPNSPDLSEEAIAAREGVEKHSIGNHAFHIELNET